MAKYLKRHEGIDISQVFVADLWREHGLKRHRQDTFNLSKDSLFAEKVADIVANTWPCLRLRWCCVWTRSRACKHLTVPSRCFPLTLDKTEKRTHDYVRHGTVNLFGALDVATGEVAGECYPAIRGADHGSFEPS